MSRCPQNRSFSLPIGRSMVNDGTAASSPSPASLPLPMTTTSRHYFGASSSAEAHDFYVDIIELGAGTSLPGLVAAKVGANVILTDSSNRVEVLENMRRICTLNKLKCKIMGLSWGEWDAPIFDLHPQIVLGADVLYDTTDFEDLFATVTFLLENSPGSVFITTYHNRSGHHLIEFLMAKWGLKCSKLLDGFSFIPLSKASSLQGNIQLVEIVLDGSQPK